MSNVYLILAYGLLWGIMAFYAVGIHLRQRRLESEMEELKRERAQG
jgi:hypothetical protein